MSSETHVAPNAISGWDICHLFRCDSRVFVLSGQDWFDKHFSGLSLSHKLCLIFFKICLLAFFVFKKTENALHKCIIMEHLLRSCKFDFCFPSLIFWSGKLQSFEQQLQMYLKGNVKVKVKGQMKLPQIANMSSCSSPNTRPHWRPTKAFSWTCFSITHRHNNWRESIPKSSEGSLN